MKARPYLVNMLLAAVVLAWAMASLLTRTFAPGVILPRLDTPAAVLLSLVALCAAELIAPGSPRAEEGLLQALLGGLTLFLLPLCAGILPERALWKIWLADTTLFAATAALYRPLCPQRGEPRRAVACLTNAFVLFLAAQALQGTLPL